MINYLALSGLIISFCGAFVTAIPVIWYRAVTTVTTSGLTETGEVTFAKTASVDDLNEAFTRLKKYATIGITVLAVGVAYGCLGLIFAS